MADIAEDAGLTPDDSILDGAAKLFGCLWRATWEEATKTANGDGDALHDMRVAIRRLRSTMQNFEGGKSSPLLGSGLRREIRDYRRRIGRLGDALGEVRDLDVLDGYLRDYAEQRLKAPIATAPGLAEFERFLQNERAGIFGPMVKRLNKCREPGGLQEEFARFALGLPAAWAPQITMQATARLLLAIRVDEVMLHGTVLSDPAQTAAHHELRKALRRLRYTLETLSTCYHEPVKPRIKTLVQLQDLLGEMQDRTVLRDNALHAFDIEPPPVGTAPPPAAASTLPEDVAAFLKYGEARRRRLLGQARRQWTQLQEERFFERLREL